jgi:hypothetical protein
MGMASPTLTAVREDVYPSQFLDMAENGVMPVALVALDVGAALFVVSAVVWHGDRWLPTGRWNSVGTTSLAQLDRDAGASPG